MGLFDKLVCRLLNEADYRQRVRRGEQASEHPDFIPTREQRREHRRCLWNERP